ncbi:MAG TPA: biopolymer transporter ExbD [Steroidobacteraceae bacterium]|jgi:biopolymer transport protein ExbD
MRRSSYTARRVTRHQRKPGELMLVSMIDIFTVLVTFLLMTAVFSRTVILELKLPPKNSQYQPLPPGLHLEVIVRKDRLQVADTRIGPLAPPFMNKNGNYDFDALAQYLQFVKSNPKYKDVTDASVLVEADTPYDTLVQVMDHVRVLDVNAGLSDVQYELFPDISIGDAPPAAPGSPVASAAPAHAPRVAGLEAPR